MNTFRFKDLREPCASLTAQKTEQHVRIKFNFFSFDLYIQKPLFLQKK